MRTIAIVIKRLYDNGELNKDQLAQRVKKGTLTLEEYKDIVNN